MDKALQSMISNMPEKTGKSLEEWKKLLKTRSFAKHSEAVNFLKKEHGVTHGFANTIVHLSKDDNDTADDLITAQYKGKEHLLPVFEKVREIAAGLGKDVSVVPKKTSVSFVRKRQFALITPATRSRLDLGLKLPGKPLTARLEDSGPFGTMCTHRVRLESPADLDQEFKDWLEEAYQKAI